jgi:ABC-type amino acid transport system permease subunit
MIFNKMLRRILPLLCNRFIDFLYASSMIANFIVPEWNPGAMKYCNHEYYAFDPMHKKETVAV